MVNLDSIDPVTSGLGNASDGVYACLDNPIRLWLIKFPEPTIFTEQRLGHSKGCLPSVYRDVVKEIDTVILIGHHWMEINA